MEKAPKNTLGGAEYHYQEDVDDFALVFPLNRDHFPPNRWHPVPTQTYEEPQATQQS
jgi:hypothetical protein